jgi:hypothetical protein
MKSNHTSVSANAKGCPDVASRNQARASIGILYSAGDVFGERRTEMLVGPMLLANILPVRFTPEQIDASGKSVNGEYHEHGSWRPFRASTLTALLDFSLPGRSRKSEELALLSAVPHSLCIDSNRLDLLQMLQQDQEFSWCIAPCRPLNSADDFFEALELWDAIIVKSRFGDVQDSPVLIERQLDQWQLTEFFQKSTLTETDLSEWLKTHSDGRWMLQRYQPTNSVDDRSYAMNITVQQRGDGAWMVPTLQCMVATESPFACLAAAAEHIGTPFVPLWENRVIPTQLQAYKGLSQRLLGLGVTLARRLQELLGGAPGAIAFRVLLDAELTPWIVNIETRAAAPTRAARNLEFFKLMVEFGIGLGSSSDQNELEIPAGAQTKTVDPISLPKQGLAIRSALKPEEIEAVAHTQASWMDVGLGQGGRSLLHRLIQLRANADDANLLLSVRLGFVTYDAAIPALAAERLNPLEDFAGKGLLRYNELRNMRCARQPLLQEQLHKALQVMQPQRPDLIFVEDIDLGLRSLPNEERLPALKATVSWLEDVCLSGQSRYWGVCLFSSRSQDAVDWFEQLLALTQPCQSFFALGLRGIKPDARICQLTMKRGLKLVFHVADTYERQWVGEHYPESSQLTPWRSDLVQQQLTLAGSAQC